jgi:hypothetical protein
MNLDAYLAHLIESYKADPPKPFAHQYVIETLESIRLMAQKERERMIKELEYYDFEIEPRIAINIVKGEKP